MPCAELRNDETFEELPAVLRASVAFEATSELLEQSSMFGKLPRAVGPASEVQGAVSASGTCVGLFTALAGACTASRLPSCVGLAVQPGNACSCVSSMEHRNRVSADTAGYVCAGEGAGGFQAVPSVSGGRARDLPGRG